VNTDVELYPVASLFINTLLLQVFVIFLRAMASLSPVRMPKMAIAGCFFASHHKKPARRN
ncbi:hypothetical protein, partial [Klebsiella oxytoca]